MQPIPSPAAWLKAQKHRSSHWLSLAVGLGVLGGLLLIAQAWFLAKTVNGVIFSDAGLKQVQPWLWAMLGIFTLRAVLARASEQAAFRGAIQVKLQLREQLYARIQAIGPVRLGTERSGDLTNSLVDGIEALDAYYARFLPAMSLMALAPLSILVFVFPVEFFATVSVAVVAVSVGFRPIWGQMEFLDGFFILLLAPEFYQHLEPLAPTRLQHYRVLLSGVAVP